MNKDYLDFRGHQLVLILIGIAIARPGDREKLFETLRLEAVRNDSDRECLEAIRDGDVEKFYGYLVKRHRVHCHDVRALEGIIRRLHELQEREFLETTLVTVLRGDFADCLGDAEAKLTTALKAVQKAKADTFASKVKPVQSKTNTEVQ